jgi:hypothetical protein
VIVAAAPAAFAQTNLQLWGNLTLDWAKSARLVYELDLEPKVLLAAPEGEPGWRNLDVTPNVEYSATPWLDLVGESTVGFTRQTDNVNSFELSPRVGLRFHLFSRHVPTTGGVLGVRELPPARRIVVRDLVRFESRNFVYTGNTGEPNSFTSRVRNRLEFLVALNKPELSDDGARYGRGIVQDERQHHRHPAEAGLLNGGGPGIQPAAGELETCA